MSTTIARGMQFSRDGVRRTLRSMIAAENELVFASVGNTRTRIATARDGVLQPSRVIDNDHLEESLAEFIDGLARDGATARTVLIASVNTGVAERVQSKFRAADLGSVLRFGTDLEIPIPDSLSDRSTVGQDRLFNALGAYWRTRQACIVIDAGTAITVDFVDGEGVFQGGAIGPGVRMMLAAMHERTAALPEVDPGLLAGSAAETPFGKNTREAMVNGALWAARGLARSLIDRYAEFYEAYPQVIATGGDAPLLFGDDPFVERIVPDLPLVGMLAAVERLAELDAEDDGRE